MMSRSGWNQKTKGSVVIAGASCTGPQLLHMHYYHIWLHTVTHMHANKFHSFPLPSFLIHPSLFTCRLHACPWPNLKLLFTISRNITFFHFLYFISSHAQCTPSDLTVLWTLFPFAAANQPFLYRLFFLSTILLWNSLSSSPSLFSHCTCLIINKLNSKEPGDEARVIS